MIRIVSAKDFLKTRLNERRPQPFTSIEAFGFPLMETIRELRKPSETIQKPQTNDAPLGGSGALNPRGC